MTWLHQAGIFLLMDHVMSGCPTSDSQAGVTMELNGNYHIRTREGSFIAFKKEKTPEISEMFSYSTLILAVAAR